MTPADLDTIRERCEAATPGPWLAVPSNPRPWGGIVGPNHGESIAVVHEIREGLANTEFLAHARTDVPALLAEVERLHEVARDALARERATEVRFIGYRNADNAEIERLTTDLAEARKPELAAASPSQHRMRFAVSPDGSRFAVRRSPWDSWWSFTIANVGQYLDHGPPDDWAEMAPVTRRDDAAEQLAQVVEKLEELGEYFDWARRTHAEAAS